MAEKYEISVERVPDRVDLVKIRKAIHAAIGERVGFDLERDEDDKLKALRVHVESRAQYQRILAALRSINAEEITEEQYTPPSLKELDERLKVVESLLGAK